MRFSAKRDKELLKYITAGLKNERKKSLLRKSNKESEKMCALTQLLYAAEMRKKVK